MNLFNENHRIQEVQFILVNDGSKDNTLEILHKISPIPKINLDIVSYEKNKGIGYAIKQGIKKIKNDIIIIMDCDLPFELEIINQSLELIKENHLVTIDRTKRKDSYPVSLFRMILHKGLIKLIKLLFPEVHKIDDFVAGFKTIRKELLNKIAPLLHSNTSLIHFEIILYTILLNNDYKIATVHPILNKQSIQKSTYSIPKILLTIVKIVCELAFIRMKIMKMKQKIVCQK